MSRLNLVFVSAVMLCAAAASHAASFEFRVPARGLAGHPVSAPTPVEPPLTCTLPWGGSLLANQSYPGQVFASSTVAEPGACAPVTVSCSAEGVINYPTASQTCSVLDPYWGSTTALLSWDNSLADGKGNLFSNYGATLSGTAKFGSGSISFGGSGARVATPRSAGFDFGTGDFTVEGWVYPTGGDGTWRELVSRYSSGAGGSYHLFGLNQSNRLNIVVDGVVRIQGNTSLPFSKWSHVAWSRESGTVRLFINGVLDGSSTFPYDLSSSNPLAIGASNTGDESFIGLMDEVRITKGVSRYNTSFGPLTNAFSRQ